MYLAAGLVLVVALSGIAIWSLNPEEEAGARPTPAQVPLRPDEGSKPAAAQNPSVPVRQDQVVVPATEVVNPSPPPRARPAATRSPESRVPQVSREIAPSPSSPVVDVAAPLARETSKELNELRDDYDTLSIRGGAVDDTLNRLWEEMRPNSPRVDMVTRQRSLKNSLERSKEALTEKDAAGARRYLDGARADLEALEQFLGRR